MLSLAAAHLAAFAFLFALPASAQVLAVGQVEIKAYQAIPKAKTAVQLSSDTHLSRELRRVAMTRIARRGNEVGFSGGNVMRMDVAFRDLLGGLDNAPSTSGGNRGFDTPGSNPRADIPTNRFGQRDTLSTAPSGATLRITLTLYSLDGGRVLWQAISSCQTSDSRAQAAGEAMINAIFDDADKNRTGDAGCPL